MEASDIIAKLIYVKIVILDAFFLKISLFPCPHLTPSKEADWIVTKVTDKYLPIYIINTLYVGIPW